MTVKVENQAGNFINENLSQSFYLCGWDRHCIVRQVDPHLNRCPTWQVELSLVTVRLLSACRAAIVEVQQVIRVQPGQHCHGNPQSRCHGLEFEPEECWSARFTRQELVGGWCVLCL